MNTLFTLQALVFAGDVFAGTAIILALAWLAAAQKSAAARHLTWAGAFAAVLSLPILAAALPSAFHILLPAPANAPLVHALDGDVHAASFTIPAPTAPSYAPDASTIVIALAALWLLGVAVIALRLAIGAACLELLKRRSRIHALAPGDEPKVAATRRECELRLCNTEIGPVTWGVFHPVILLPKSAVSWPRERLHAVLLHELAHIRRHDALAQALSHVACALHWPNPLVWIAAKNLRREAEIAADDAVISSGVRPSSYAGELLELAAEFRTRRYSTIPLFMAEPSALKVRVESVLDPTQKRCGVTKMDGLKIASLGLIAASAIAFACPSLAQDTAPAAPATPVEQTALPPPPAPPAVPAAPVTAPAAPSAPSSDEMPAPPVPPAKPAHPHIIVDGRDWEQLSPEEKARVRAEIAQAREEAREAMAKARPEIEKAVAAARASTRQITEAQLAAARAEIEKHRADIERVAAEVKVRQQVLDDAQPAVEAAIAELKKHRVEINAEVAKIKPELDKALAKIKADMDKQHVDVRLEERLDEALRKAQLKIDTTHDGDGVHIESRTDTSDGNHVVRRTDTTGTPDTTDPPVQQ